MRLDYNVAKQLIEEYAMTHRSPEAMPWLDSVNKFAGMGVYLMEGDPDDRVAQAYAKSYFDLITEELNLFAQAGYKPSSEVITIIMDTRTLNHIDPIMQGFIVGWACVMKRGK